MATLKYKWLSLPLILRQFTLRTSGESYGSDTAVRTDLINACVYTSRAAACFKSSFPRCFCKDSRIRLLQLNIMASAVAAIHVSLTLSKSIEKKRFWSHNISKWKCNTFLIWYCIFESGYKILLKFFANL